MTLTDTFYCKRHQCAGLSYRTCLLRQGTRTRIVDNEQAYLSYQDCTPDCEQGAEIEEMFKGHDLYPMKYHKVHKRETPKKRGKQGESPYSSHFVSPPVVLRNTPDVVETYQELQADRQRRRDLPGGQLSQAEKDIADLLDMLGRSPY